MSAVLPGSLQTLLDQTLGACFIGFLFTAILYGVTCIQTYLYFAKNARDELQLKLIIVLLWILGTIQLIFITLALYHYMVDNFSNVLAVLIPFWSLPAMVALSATIECIVRGIFISRVWILSRSKWLTAVLASLNLMVFIVGVVFSRHAFEFKTFLQFFSDGAVSKLVSVNLSALTTSRWIVYLAFSTDFVLDIIITMALSYYLLKIRYGFSSTTRFVNKLIITILNSGVMTSIMSLAVLSFFAGNQNSFGFMAVYFPLSQVFYNALLASLNLRESLRDERAGAAMELTVSETHGGDSSVRRPLRVPFLAGARNHADETLTETPLRHIAIQMEKNMSTDLIPNRGPPRKDYPEAIRGKETIISMV